jgi:hypothetical protein
MFSNAVKVSAILIIALGLSVFNLCAQGATSFHNLPLWFEAESGGQFIAHTAASEFVVSSAGTEFTLKKSDGSTASCYLQFVGANPAPNIAGDQPLTGKISRFIGNQPERWQTGLPTFSRVRVENVYPGVNVVYYGNQKTLEYDFALEKEANPAVIALRFSGAERISIDPTGSLVIKVKAGEIVQHAPRAYQIINGSRKAIEASYKILGETSAGFALGDYDHSLPLVIDPVLSYSTYYGGNFGDAASAIAVNPTDGSIYVAGQTFSTQYLNNVPFATPGAFLRIYQGGGYTGDAFIARFDSTGTNLIYATYLGGSGDDGALCIAVDPSGNAYVAGYTDSADFPTTNALYKLNPYYTSTIHPTHVFVTELNPAGNALVYSTYLGGNSMDSAFGIALDPAGNAYITGYTYSSVFPVTTNAFQKHAAFINTVYFNANAFVSVIGAGGTNLNYSTYLGGTNFDEGQAIAFKQDRVFVAGFTRSTNFPSTNCLSGFNFLNGINSSASSGDSDAFVTAFDASNPSNLVMLYSTYLGGTNNNIATDFATGIAADANGNAYVVGGTTSTNFPFTATNVAGLHSFVHTNTAIIPIATNGFLTQIKWDGTNASIGYSAMFGGVGVNVANGVAVDPAGNAYVVGSATCTNFPVTTNNISGHLSATNNSLNQSYSDAFVIAFNADCSALLYSAYIGGTYNDFGYAITVDPAGIAYIAGQTVSPNFPAVNAYQSFLNGQNDMFIAAISPDNSLKLNIALQNATTPVSGQNDITVQWKMFPAIYTLATSTDLTSNDWHVLTISPTYSNGLYNITLPATNDAQFFKLNKN